MPPNVTATASLMCSFGAAPSTLAVIPSAMVNVEGKPAATVMDTQTGVNIPPFGMCMTPSNPQVAAATAAALGVLTPVPCLPVTGPPWAPGAATTMVGGKPALTMGSTCTCTWGGVITIVGPPAAQTMSN